MISLEAEGMAAYLRFAICDLRLKCSSASQSQIAICKSQISFPLIRLIQKLDYFFARVALPQEAAEHVLLQVREDDVHCLQMLLRLILRAEQQYNAVHRLMI